MYQRDQPSAHSATRSCHHLLTSVRQYRSFWQSLRSPIAASADALSNREAAPKLKNLQRSVDELALYHIQGCGSYTKPAELSFRGR